MSYHSTVTQSGRMKHDLTPSTRDTGAGGSADIPKVSYLPLPSIPISLYTTQVISPLNSGSLFLCFLTYPMNPQQELFVL